jgi:hypothetical protein
MSPKAILAIAVLDPHFEVATTNRHGHIVTEQFENSDEGIGSFLEWTQSQLGGEADPQWVVSIPEGDGGFAYEWLYENISEVFLQSPQSLKNYAEARAVPWSSAVTLHDFNRSKEW